MLHKKWDKFRSGLSLVSVVGPSGTKYCYQEFHVRGLLPYHFFDQSLCLRVGVGTGHLVFETPYCGSLINPFQGFSKIMYDYKLLVMKFLTLTGNSHLLYFVNVI